MQRQSVMWCNKYNYGFDDFHKDFQNVLLYGESKERLTNVMVTLAEEGEPFTHYAWWDYDKGEFTLVYKTWSMVDMCFTYGSKVCSDAGDGNIFRVNVTEIKKEVPDEN